MSNYCLASEVLDGPLRGMSIDNVGSTRDSQLAYINGILPAAKLILDNEANRDFDQHTDDVIELDGTDADTIQVWKDDQTLCVPIQSVTYIKVYGQNLTITDLKIDSRSGILGFQRSPTERLAVRRQLLVPTFWFPRDLRNVEVKLTWGYSAVPEDIKLAAQYVAAMLTVVTVAGGMSAGARRRKIRDFEIEYTSGPFATQMRKWGDLAAMILSNYRTGYRP